MKKIKATDILSRINRDNLAHLLPSFAQRPVVPTSFWANFLSQIKKPLTPIRRKPSHFASKIGVK
jgi:hypothetical protein